VEFTLSFLEDIARRVVCQELQFSRDRSIVEFVRRA